MARAEAFFNTRLDAVAQANVAAVGYANVTPARVPAAIARDVIAVTGLDNLVTAHDPRWAHATNGDDAARSKFSRALARGSAFAVPFEVQATNDARDDAGRCSPGTAADTVDVDQPQTAASGNVGYGPSTFESDFNLPIERGCGGAGVTIALVDGEETPLQTDISQYYNYFRVNHPAQAYTTREVLPSTLLDATEITLDTELVSSLAPDANVDLYMTDAGADGVANAMNAVAADNTASVLSTSFITCESYGSDYFNAQDSAAQQLAAQGITVVTAVGDTMYEDCFGNPGIEGPAGSAYVVAVGGVQPATSTSAYRSVTGWSGTTGGTSIYAAKPKYQRGIAACSTAYRCVPDLALASGAGTYPIASTVSGGAFAFTNGVSHVFAGTFVAAPIFAAMQVEADQYAGRRMGAIDPILYADFYLLGSNNAADPFQIFSDVTTGSSSGVSATKGWDFVTGLGVPDGVRLARVESL